MVGTPSSRALSALLPASVPTTTTVVFLLTLEVTLPRGAALTVRVPALGESRAAAALTLAAADGAPYFGVNPGGAIQQSWPLAGGVATVPDVPAGSWRLQVTAADGRVWSSSLNTNGEAASAVIE